MNTPLSYSVTRWKSGEWQHIDDSVSPEECVYVSWPGSSCRLWAWPDDLEPLCVGHALLDYLHLGPEAGPSPYRMSGSVRAISIPPGIEARHAFAVELNREGRRERDETPSISMTPKDIVRHMDAFLSLEGSCPLLWESTGCFHRAGMFDPRSGVFLRLAEDIGRHNCIDRLAGWACLNGIDPASTVLFVSARITSSLYAKARRAGFSFLVSRSAVTSMPVEMAREQNRRHPAHPVTLLGFCRPREERFTVFAGEGRIA